MIQVKLTSAIVIDGQIVKAGEIVPVSESEAKSLMHRGKAILAVVDQAAKADQPDESHEEADEPAAKRPRKAK